MDITNAPDRSVFSVIQGATFQVAWLVRDAETGEPDDLTGESLVWEGDVDLLSALSIADQTTDKGLITCTLTPTMVDTLPRKMEFKVKTVGSGGAVDVVAYGEFRRI